MKKKEFQDYRGKIMQDLERELHDLEVRAHTLRTDIITGKVKSLKEMRSVKKSIAQIRTLMTEKASAK